MKNILVTCMLIAVSISGNAQNQNDSEQIKQVIQTAYVEGLQNEGDVKKIDSGIHPKFNLLGMEGNEAMWKLSIKDWKAKQVKKREEGKLPIEDDKKVNIKFKHIDITGNAAMVKIEFYIGQKLTYVDYISLYKFKSGWKMVNKIYNKM